MGSNNTRVDREPATDGEGKGGDNPLGFALDFLGGRAHVTLQQRRVGGFLRLERLALEVPNVTFPFDVSGGAGRFRHRRCRLRRLELWVEAEAFAAWFTSRKELAAFGFEGVELQFEPGRLQLRGRAHLGGREVPFAARLGVTSGEHHVLQLRLSGWQTYGYLPLPPPLLGVGLLAAAGVRPEPTPEVGAVDLRPPRAVALQGASGVRLDLVQRVLRELLPAFGWRLPEFPPTLRCDVELTTEGLHLSLQLAEDQDAAEVDTGVEGEEPPSAELADGAVPGDGFADDTDGGATGTKPSLAWEATPAPGVEHAEGERLIAAGRVGDALRFYEQRQQDVPADRFAQLRLLELYACAPATRTRARRLARRLLAESEVGVADTDGGEPATGEGPGAGVTEPALFALANIAEEAGEPEEAASRYAALASLAEKRGDRRGAVQGTLACGRLLAEADPDQAISWYERVLVLEPDLPAAVAALTGLYRRKGRVQELLRLQHRYLARATDRQERLRGHLTLGRTYLVQQEDALRARAEFERAVRLDDGSLAAWDGLAQAHHLAGAHDRERRALERVIELCRSRGDEEALFRARLRTAQAWADAGDLGRALAAIQDVLETHADSADALELHGRLCARAGQWEAAAESLERLLAVGGLSNARRAEVALELARIRAEGLADEAGARIFVEASIAARETVEALQLAVRIAESDGRFIDVVELLGRLVERLQEQDEDTVEERAALTLRRAEVLATELQDRDHALATLEEWIAAVTRVAPGPSPGALPPGVRQALRLLAELRRDQGQMERFRAAVLELADLLLTAGIPPAEPEVRLMLAVGELLSAAARDFPSGASRGEALRLLRRLHAAIPQDPRPLMALTDLLDAPQEQAEREGLLERLARVTERKGDAGRQAQVLRELGTLRRVQGRLEDARIALRAAARLAPTDPLLQVELGEVAYALQAWEEAEAAFQAADATAEPGNATAQVALRLGQLALRAEDYEQATARLQDALQGDPPANGEVRRSCHRALQEACSRAGRWAEAAAAFEAEAGDEHTNANVEARVAARFAAAEIQRRRLGRADDARRLYDEVLASDPDHLGAMNGLTVLAAGAQQWERVAELLERKLRLLAGSDEVTPLLEELAELYADRLDRPQAARSAYERVLERAPDHREALRFVGRDALVCGDLEIARARYHRLLDLEPEAGTAPEQTRKERLEVHRALARIAEAEADRAETARHLAAVLDLDPTDRDALEELDGLYGATQRWEDLAAVLRRRADQARAPEEAVQVLLRLASVLEAKLEQPREAAAVCREVLRREPDRADALARLARLLRVLDAEPVERRRVLERLLAVGAGAPEPEVEGDALPTRADLLFELGLLLREELGELRAGAQMLEEALALGGNDVALHRALVHIAREEAKPHALDQALSRLIAASADVAERAAAVQEQAQIRLESLQDAEGALAALESLPAAEWPDATLELAARIHGARRSWDEAFEARAERARRAASRGDTDAEGASLEAMLRLAAGELADDDAVIDTAHRLLQLDASHEEALAQVARVARRQRHADEWLMALDRQVERIEADPDRVLEAADRLEQSAWLCLITGDAPAAVERCDRALHLDPDHETARFRLAEAYAVQGAFAEAAEALEELCRRLARSGRPEGEARVFLGDLHRAVAELAAVRLEDSAHARTHWRAAAGLLSGPALVAVLDEWAVEASGAGHFREAAEVLERLAQLRADTGDAVRLAEAYEELGRVDDALRVLRDAPPTRDEDPLAQTVRTRMRELLGAAGRYGELARTLEEDAQRADDPDRRRELLFEAADHYLSRAGEGGRAERCLLAILQDAPSFAPAVRLLVERAESGRRGPDVDPALARAARTAMEAGDSPEAEDAPERAQLLTTLAEHHLERDPQDPEAFAWLGAAVVLQPFRVEVLRRYADHLEEQGLHEERVERLDASLAHPALPREERAAIRVRLAEALGTRLGRPERALEVLQAREADEPEAPAVTRRRLELEIDFLEGLERLEEAETALRQLATHVEDPHPLLERATTLAERRGDLEAGIRVLWQRVEAQPSEAQQKELLETIAAWCEEVGDPDGQGRALEQLVARAEDEAERAERLLGLGRARMAQQRWQEAKEALAEAAEVAPGSVPIHLQRARVARQVEDLEGARAALATAHDLLPESDREVRADVSLERSRLEEELGGDRALARRYARQAAAETQQADRRAQALRRAWSLAQELEDRSQEEEALRALFDLGMADVAELGRLAALCEQREAWAEALMIYEHQREAAGADPAVLRNLAGALRATGQRGRAVEQLRAAGQAWVEQQEHVPAAECFQEAAALLLEQGEDAEADAEARRLLLRAVSHDPRNDAAFEQAARLCRRAEAHEELLEVLTLRLPGLDPAGKQAAYKEMAFVAHDGLDAPDRAATYLALGLAAAGDEPELLAALVLYHVEHEEWAVAADYGRRLDAVGGPPPELAHDVHQSLAAGALARDERAVARLHLRRALRAEPEDVELRLQLETLLTQDGEFVTLRELLRERAQREEGLERAGTLARAAQVSAEELDEPGEAERLYEEALSAAPEADKIRDALIALLREREHWSALFEQLTHQWEHRLGPQRAAVADQLAELAESQLGDPATAQHYRRQALRDAPADVRRLRALVDLLASQRQWDALVELLEEAVDTMVLDAESASGFYALLGRSYLEKLERPDQALAVFERARVRGALTPRTGDLLAELYESSARFTDLATLLDELAERQESSAMRQRLLVKRARVLADHLGQPAEAATVLLDLFRVAPDRRRKLGRMARKLLVQARMPEDALRVLEEELEITSGPEQGELYLERGELFESALGRTEDALASYLKVLELSPGYPPAHVRVARLLLDTGEMERGLLHAESALRGGDLEVTLEAHKLAGSLCDELDRTDEAIEHLEAAVRQDPTDVEALRDLAHLYTAQGDWERLAENMGRELTLTVEPVTRGRLWYRRALVYRDMLDRGGEALRCFREAVNADPENAEAVAALRDFALERGDWETSLTLLERQLAMEPDPMRRAQLQVKRADLLENRLGRVEDAIGAIEEALAAVGGEDEGMLRKLSQLSAARQDWARAAQIEQRLATHLPDAATRAAGRMNAAALYERAGHNAEACTLYLEVISEARSSHVRKAAERLVELVETDEQRRELLQRIDEQLPRLEGTPHRQSLLQHGVKLASALGETEQAGRYADALLTEDPADRVAFLHRRHTLEAQGDWPGLAALLSRRLAVATPEETLDLLTTLGQLQRERLRDLDAAAATFDQLLALRPDDLVALDGRADVAFHRGEFAEALEFYDRLGGRQSSLDAGELAYRRGRIAEALGEEGAAITHYERAVKERPGHVPALEALARLHLLHERDAEALEPLAALRDVLPRDEPERSLACGLQLARVQLRLGELEAALEGLERLAQRFPNRPAVLKRLAEVQHTAQRWEPLADSLSRLARLSEQPLRRARALFEEGEIRLERLDDAEGASRCFREAADLAPRDPVVLVRLAEQYARLGQWDDAVGAYRQLLEALPPTELGVGVDSDADAQRGEALLGLALTSLVHGGEEARQAPALIRSPTVETVAASHAAELLSALAAGLYERGETTQGLRRVFDLADSALGRASLPRWTQAAEHLARERPTDLALRRLLVRLISRVGESSMAALHEGVVRFVDPVPELTPPPDGPRPVRSTRILRVYGPAVPENAKVPLRTVLTALHPALGRVASPIDPSALGPEIDDIHGAELAALVEDLKEGLETGPVGAVFARHPRRPVEVLYGHPPVLLVDPRLVQWSSHQSRFLLGHALELIRSGTVLLLTEPPDRAMQVLDSVATLFGIPLPKHTHPDPEIVERLRSRGFGPELFDNRTMESIQVAYFNHYRDPVDLPSYARIARHVANRFGLLVSGRLDDALWALAAQRLGDEGGADAVPADGPARRRLILRDPELAELVRFGTSPLYNTLLRRRSTLPRV